jgi:hypothetical protein
MNGRPVTPPAAHGPGHPLPIPAPPEKVGTDSPATGLLGDDRMVRTGMDATLLRRLSRGEYVVDEHAVADAILRRSRSGSRASGVLIPLEVFDDLLARRGEPDAAASGGSP